MPRPRHPSSPPRRERLLTRAGLPTARDETRGLDHGGYVPLVEMYPEADVPVVQLSLPTLDPRTLFAVGERLAPLRDAGHPDRRFRVHHAQPRRGFARRTPRTARCRARRPSSTSGPRRRWPTGTSTRCSTSPARRPPPRLAHPRTEHWAPLYVALGAAHAGGFVDQPFDDRRLLVRPVQALLAAGLSRPFPCPPSGAGTTPRLAAPTLPATGGRVGSAAPGPGSANPSAWDRRGSGQRRAPAYRSSRRGRWPRR